VPELPGKPAMSAAKPDFVIFMFGGSTTLGIDSPDDMTIASLLAKKLNRADSEYRYLVRNYGVNAFVSDQELHLLVDLLKRGEQPDAVIFYNGLNDVLIKVGLGRMHFYAPTFDALLFRKPGPRARLRGLAGQSRLVQLVTERGQFMARLLPFIGDRAILRKNADRMLSEYRQTLRLARALAREYKFENFHFWQPSLLNTGKTLSAAETAIAESNSELHRLAQLAQDVVDEVMVEQQFFDTTPVADIRGALDRVTETIFLDSAHISPIGNDAVAEAISGSISNRLVER